MLKVNLGCGPHAIAGWTNYDLEPHPGVVKHDLTKPLPLADASVDRIRSEHFIEHIKRPEALALLKECRRVMKPGAFMRISIPSLEEIIIRWVNNDPFNLPGCWEPKTSCQMVNEAMREWGHQFIYDRTELMMILEEAGFNDYSFCKWKESEVFEAHEVEIRPFQCEHIVEVRKEA